MLGERQYFQMNIKANQVYTVDYMRQRLQKMASGGQSAVDEAELLDILKRLMSKLILNSKDNQEYASISQVFPELIMSLHIQAPYLKEYSFVLLKQIFWTPPNKTKNSLMPINFLQKDCQSSDPMVRAQAIKMLTDMCSNLNDIFPFIYEILKGGLAD